MSELRIEAHESFEGVDITTDVIAENLEISIFNGDELVAKVSLESLVKKFLAISSEYMQAMAIINKIKASQAASTEVDPNKSKIILTGGS